jgi:glutamate/tyrosine decarboxylase-like PLP-dependent enzyme
MERADSLAFDLHKWGSMPFECACVLVRDPAVHRAAFASSASYIDPMARGVIAGGLPFAERGLELTRNFKALKVWMSLTANGADHHARLIEQNVRQAQALAALIEAHPSLELMAPVPLNVVCFRYAPAGAPESGLDALNEELLLRLQERGLAVPSGTRLAGRYAIRVANVNHRSRMSDFTSFVEDVVALGEELVGEGA